MLLATLLLSGRGWLLPAALVLAAAGLLVLWAYVRAPADRGVRAACALLKLLGVAALAACLLEPLWTGQRARPGANYFAILADNSQGLQLKDRGEPRSRGEMLRGLLTDDPAGWQARLEENFQVRRYLFDARLQAAKDFNELAFDGRATALGAALRTVAERYKGQPLAGVLLLTDGNATDLANGAPDLAGLPPVYPVVLGHDTPIKDLAIQNVTVSQTAFEDAPVSVQADVTCAGYAGASLVAQLIEVASPRVPPAGAGTNVAGEKSARPLPHASSADAPERVVAEDTARAPRDGQVQAFRFQVRPDKSGVLFYRLRVSAKAELAQFGQPETAAEATLANNQRIVVVDRGRGPYRVLYVAGRPNWEYKFLQRALAEDDQVQVVGLIRIARREPKFEFRGRAGESSNPLFRGFAGQSKDDVERYDQPVLVRLNTRDEFELRGGFPKLPEDLFAYHAVIVDDLEAEFFTADQMSLLQKFVSERGGGFLMLGGAETFFPGQYHRTPVGDLLPVYLDQLPDAPATGDLRLALTREGWLQPWARLRNNESDEKARLAQMPPFFTLNRVRGVRPGASVIAAVTDAKANVYPAVVAQRFGRGRTAALTLGDMWHWGLRDPDVHHDLDKAWRQLVRWLVADVPNRVDVQVEQKRDDPNQAVLLQVRARDPKFLPLDNAAVTIAVSPVGADARKPAARSMSAPGQPAASAAATTNQPAAIHFTAEPDAQEAGLYQATFVPRDTGGYHVTAVVTNAVGAEAGRAEAGWSTDLAAEEFRSLKPNRALLETIAQKTGGEIIAADKLDEFARGLPLRQVPITESWSFPLWHQAAVFLFALACFVAEWGLRRLKGLA
jgi:uncharacterized membrane protein